MIFNCHCTHPHPIVWGGVGWGGMITSLAFPSLEVYPRKRARHAILKYGNACVLSSGGGSAQVKTWWKPLLTRWRKFEKKLRLPFFRLKSWKGFYSQSRWTFFLQRFSMKKNAPRCDEILIFIIFVGRQRFRRDIYVCTHRFQDDETMSNARQVGARSEVRLELPLAGHCQGLGISHGKIHGKTDGKNGESHGSIWRFSHGNITGFNPEQMDFEWKKNMLDILDFQWEYHGNILEHPL